MDDTASIAELQAEIARLRSRLEDAEGTLNAIQSGEVDALVIQGPNGPQVFTLKGEDEPYRLMIERMHEGAITVSPEGVILFSNQRFADLLRASLEHVIGSTLADWAAPSSAAALGALLRDVGDLGSDGELTLERSDGSLMPVYMSLNTLAVGDLLELVCVVVTDLTKQKANERKINLLQTLQLAINDAPDIDSALAIVLRRVCKEVDWALGEVWTLSDDRQTLQVSPAWYSRRPALDRFHQAATDFHYAPGVGSIGAVWQRREALWLPDITIENLPRSALARAMGVRASLVVPVFAGDAIAAVLAFYSEERREQDDTYMQMIAALATQLGIYIEHKRAEQALRQSEDRFRSLVENSGDIIATLDANANITYESRSIERILGYAVEEVMHGSAFAHIHPDDMPLARSVYERLLVEKSDTLVMEIRDQHKDGSWRVLEVFAKNYLDVPAIQSIVVNARDVTERRQIERALRDSEERFRSLVHNSSDIISILSAEGQIVYESRSVERVLGYQVEEALQQSAFEMIHPDDIQQAMTLFAQLLAEPQTPQTTIIRYLHKDGGWRELEVTAVNHLDNPTINGIVLNSRDVTDRRRIEQALRDSEERYRLVARATNDVIWDWDLVTGDIRWNEALYDVFGYSHDEPTDSGHWWTEHVHPDDLDAVNTSVEVIQNGSEHFWDGEYRFRRADGEYAHITDRGYIVRDESGRGVRMIGAMTDLTERYRAQQALQKALDELNLVYTQSADMIAAISLTHFLRVNPAFERILGYSPQELLTIPFLDLLHPEDLERSRSQIVRMEQHNTPATEFGNRFRCKDGSYRWIEWNTTPYLDGIAYAVGRDVTERYEAQAEIRKLNAELEQRVVERTAQLLAVNRELEAFSYSVSHDLRAPLRAIDGFSHALLEDYAGILPEEARYFLERIRVGTQRMGQLIDDLLKLSRITRDEMKREPVDLSAIARSIVRDLREADPQREVEVVIADGLTARGDARLMRAALVNLLGNAWKFSSKQPQSRIEFGQTTGADRRTFFVRDNGVGFDMTYADKLFGAFQRLHTQTEFEGTGIGLATVQRIIRRHGGDVWAESQPGKGATFYFSL